MKPEFQNNHRSRRLIPATALLLLFIQPPPAFADVAAGKTIFTEQKCGSCHQTSGPVAELPVTERASIKGPPLWFAGSKFKAGWLRTWLEKPEPVRRVKYGTLEKGNISHPALQAADADQVGEYLLSLVDAEMKTGIAKTGKLSRRTQFKAEKLFAKKQVCFGCHLYPSRQGNIGGFTGPSLVGAGARLQPDWILAFIRDNLRYYPNGRMPVYGDQVFEPFTDQELELLGQFISNL